MINIPLALHMDGFDLSRLPAAQQQAVADAVESFAQDVEAAPASDAADPEYFAYWQSAAKRSNDVLRPLLGAARYNALSGVAAQSIYEQEAAAARHR